MTDRDRDVAGRPRNARPRDDTGRPLPHDPASSAAEGRLDEPEPTSPDAAVRTAQELLTAGAAFRAHEVFEAQWKATAGIDRDLWRGLAQLAVGVTHAQRGNDAGRRALLARAAQTLAPYAGQQPHGVDIDALRAWALTAVAALDPASSLAVPPLLAP